TSILGVTILSILGLAIWASVQDVAANSQVYENRLVVISNWVSENVLSESSGPMNTKHGEDSVAINDSASAFQDALQVATEQLRSLLLQLVGSMSILLSYGILIALFVFFLLSSDRLKTNQPKIMEEIEDQVRRYLVLKTLISVATGIAFGGILWAFGVPLAILFGVLAFLLNYIPNIGPLVANVLPIPLLILNSEISVGAAIVCILLITAIQFISGNVIETRMMGKSFDVSPVVLLLSLMFFGLVWGIIGMFLATPLVSILKIALQNTDSGKPIAELMAGRWQVNDA
ncbi:MAG: AI-2E family transporter, partial [Planctomycetota bacterium]